jgi:hypothetical protein
MKIIEKSKVSFLFENEFIFQNFKIKQYLEYLDNYWGKNITENYKKIILKLDKIYDVIQERFTNLSILQKF